MATQHKLNTFGRVTLTALAVATALSSNTAIAQEDDEDKVGLERIEVTARRTAENLQETPVAVSSIGAAELLEKGIQTVTDIQQHVPNTTLQVSRGTNSTLTAFIRGIGQQDPLWGFEPGVAIYIDDVYVARPQGAVLDVLDIERVEVLRGPQGTLYGKNAVGGAVKYVTKALSGDTEFSFNAGIGNFNQRNLRLAGQTAITDKFFVGAAFATLNRDGFGTFRNTGEDNYNKDITTGRITLEYHASDDLKFRLLADQTQDDSNARGGYRLTPSLLNPGQEPYDNVFDSDSSLPVDNEVVTKGVSLTIDWNIDEAWTFRSITARRLGETDTNIDFDATEVASFDVPAVYDDDQTTQEFQLLYNSDKLNVVSGLYYYTGRASGAFGVQLTALGQGLGLPGFTLENGGFVDTDSYSAYFEADYALDDQWTLIVGGRYNRDEKEAFVYRDTQFAEIFPEDGNPRNFTNGFTADESWSDFSGKLGVQYQASDDVMYYATFTQAFKSGGFNMRADIASDPEGNQPFDPEMVDTWEFGFKSEFFDNRIRLNGAIFYNDYTDLQVTVQRATTNDNFVARVLNAGEVTAEGAELELLFAATDSTNFFMNVGFINAGFDEFINQNPITGEIENQADQVVISNTPRWTSTAGFDHTFDFYKGEVVLNGNVSFRSDQAIFEIPNPTLDQGSYNIVNLSAIYYHDDGRFNAGLHIRNLTDKEYRIAGYSFPGVRDGNGNVIAGGLGGEDTITAFYGDPRTVEFTIGYNF